MLAEIAARSLERAGLAARVRPGMGGTIILWEALRRARSTCYPEYTGTIREEILKDPSVRTPAEIAAGLARQGIGMTASLGFSDSYALVMRKDRARDLGIRTISDLARHPELKAGFTHEFLGRRDGWTPLSRAYGISLADVRGIDHAIGYAALESGAIDIKDAYSTDARLARPEFVALDDDRNFFPDYEAVLPLSAQSRRASHGSAARPGGKDRCRADAEPQFHRRGEARLQRCRRAVLWARNIFRRSGRDGTPDRRSMHPPAPVPRGRFAFDRRVDRRPARHFRGPPARRWRRDSRSGRGRPDDSRARPAGAAGPRSVLRHPGDHGDQRSLSLQPASDRAQHGDGAGRHRCVANGIDGRHGPLSRNPALSCRASTRLAFDPRRNPDERGHRHRQRHAGGLDRRRRARRADHFGPEPERPSDNPARSDSRRSPRGRGPASLPGLRPGVHSARLAPSAPDV